MKNKLSSFEEYFKMEFGVFHLVLSFTALKIFRILYYVDVTMLSQRGGKTQNEEYLCK